MDGPEESCKEIEEKDTNFACILELPVEIIEHIFTYTILDYKDVLNVSEVCSILHEVGRNNKIWRQKLGQRWPRMLARYQRLKVYDWYKEFKSRHSFGVRVKSAVGGLSSQHYLHDEVSKEDFHEFTTMTHEHEQAGEFLIDELMSIVNDGDSDKNLTLKYYAEKVLRFMQQTLLSKKVQAFTEVPPECQLLETGACLLAQWCQPFENFTQNDISDQLDSLASEVSHNLKTTWPHHPAVKADINIESVTSDLWNSEHCKMVLDSINRVMFNKHKFEGNKTRYYDINNSYINKVLSSETGIPITLSIVYSAIARRLGVICEPVNAPSHFLLRWKQDPSQSLEHMYTYIDVFNGGKFLSYGQLHTALNVPETLINLNNMKITSPVQVLERMIRNLIAIGREQGRMGDNLLCLRNALEFSLLISPDDFEMRLLLVRVLQNLQVIADEDQNRMGLVAYLMDAAQTQMEDNKVNKDKRKINVKTRKKPKDALYSVGLIMKHRRYDYDCVIYGWDAKCEATHEWIIQMGVDRLPHKDKQPFYNVLVSDGTNRYAAEESLEMHPECCPITHPEVGKYFTSYEKTHYIPNTEKATEYPEDIELTEKLVHEHHHT
ncbi:F-box only protein 21-like isoform X2 [Ruditapes philippinarum]|uniref:F-box only protein 21-like isoform X2 n=1 Tax=Ruditapes philippinarum TaxID=129788 RepID=UPI00295BE908|nr:F-box only protein 21-like isoform X2 [Ruditapes philippinarum]